MSPNIFYLIERMYVSSLSIQKLGRLYRGGIWKFFVYYFFSYFYLWVPIWIIYLQQRRNFSLTQASLLDAIFLISVTILEIPTGIIADTVGRKVSVVAGGVTFAVSMIIYASSTSFILLALTSIMRAIAISLISGAEKALLYDVLLEQHREKEYTDISGKLMATKQISLALAAISGGLLATVSLSLPFYLTSAMTAIGVAGVSSIHIKMRDPVLTSPRRIQRYQKITSSAFYAVTHNITIAYAIFFITILRLPIYAFPVILVQPYAMSIGIPVSYLGVIAALYRLANTLGFFLSGYFLKKLGVSSILLISPLIIVCSLILVMSIRSLTGVLLFMFAGVVVAVVRPIVDTIIQEESPDDVRATMLSIQSLIFMGITALVGLLLGRIADLFNISVSYKSFVFGMVLTSLPIYFLFPKVAKRFRNK